MALTTNQLAVALRLAAYDENGAIPDLAADISEQIVRLNSVAGELISAYAPTAPETIKDQATVLFCGYLVDKPTVSGTALANAWANSGAGALLARWRPEGGGVISPSAASPGMTPSSNGASIPQELADKIGTLIVQGVGDTNTDAGEHTVETLVISEAEANTGLDVTFEAAEKKLILYLPPQIKQRVKDITLDGTTLRWTEVDSTGTEHAESAAITGSGGAGLTQAQVDDRIETYTGQTTPSGTLARGRIPRMTATLSGAVTRNDIDARVKAHTGQLTTTGTLARDRVALATTTEPGTISAAMKAVIDRVQDTEGPGQVGKYLGLSGAQGQIAAVDAPTGGGGGGLTQAQVDARIVAAARALTSTTLADTDSLVVSDASVAAGEPRRVWSVADLDARIAAKAPSGGGGLGAAAVENFAKTATPNARLPYNRLPLTFLGLEDALNKIGWNDEPRITLHIGTSLQGVTLVPRLTYAAAAERGTRIDANAYVHIKIPSTLLEEVDLKDLRIVWDGDTPTMPLTGDTWTRRTATGGNTYYRAVYPGGTQAGVRIKAQRFVSPVFDSEETLEVVRNQFSYNELRDRPPNAQRSLFSGSLTGVAISTNISTSSAVTLTNLTDPLDLDDEGHGLIAGSMTFGLTGRSNLTVGFSSQASGNNLNIAQTVPFTVSLESIARTPRYLASASEYGFIIASVEIWYAALLYGTVVVRASRDANNRVGLNAQYLANAGTNVPSPAVTASVTLSGDVAVLPTGIPRGGASGTSGLIYEFADALPTADETYADGDLALVYDSESMAQGLYRKGSTVTHVKADTGLAGLTLDPSTDLFQQNVTRYTHQYFNRSSTFQARAGNGIVLAVHTLWSDAPTVLSTLDFDYNTLTRSDGEIDIHFTSARSYRGVIRVSAGTFTVDIQRLNSTEWRVTGLTAPQVTALRENDWVFSEPGATGTKVDHQWDEVLRGVDRASGNGNGMAPAAGGTVTRTSGIIGVSLPSTSRQRTVLASNSPAQYVTPYVDLGVVIPENGYVIVSAYFRTLETPPFMTTAVFSGFQLRRLTVPTSNSQYQFDYRYVVSMEAPGSSFSYTPFAIHLYRNTANNLRARHVYSRSGDASTWLHMFAEARAF